MSKESKYKTKHMTGLSDDILDVLEEAGILTPKDIKLADDSDLEAAGLTPEEIQTVRQKCPAFSALKE